MNNFIKEKVCNHCGKVFYGGNRAKICLECKQLVKQCECGCGNSLLVYIDGMLSKSRFKHGHFFKTNVGKDLLRNYTKNRQVSIETKQKVSKSLQGHITMEETKRKISEKLKGRILVYSNPEERIRKISKSMKGVKKPPFTDMHKQNIGLASKGKKRAPITEEHRRKLSEARIRVIQQKGGCDYNSRRYKKGVFYSIKNQKELRYDSSLELCAYQILEQLSKVKSYDRCKFSIDYTFKDSMHKYLPDIEVVYIDGSKDIIEVKPIYLINDEKNQAKFIAAKEYCDRNNMKYSIWTDKDIKSSMLKHEATAKAGIMELKEHA